ncbi:phosphoribosylanthranilate isomerase [Neisseria sp. 74A18]|uniref:phosphoribosylanthranilate isomerase n=1 Tax=Neisseria sp. 74A18 TaxID=1696094 RepID=UPI0006CAEFFB|nr:phosphoribosylanthranilate isomerase [Neisseria sp. 74A18]KPN74123.1 N-(5'-phosphoribosyl)anthranilate isomerase [Neisseria sp. 74A18]
MNIRVKICGITRPEDALAAARAGADAVGLVFYEKSKRRITVAQAQEIVRVLPPFVSVVALFVNEDAARIHDILAQVPVDVIQFHGDEDDAFCAQFRRPYLKAVRVRHAEDIQTACAQFPNARALLFDAYHPTEYGGTGQQFDWMLLPKQLDKPWVLAGGLTPENVAEAVRVSGAAAVDVSGGVEVSGGIKDHDKIAAFLAAVQTCRL